MHSSDDSGPPSLFLSVAACRDDMSNRQRNCMKSILLADDEESLRILIYATLDYIYATLDYPDYQIVEASDGDGSSSET